MSDELMEAEAVDAMLVREFDQEGPSEEQLEAEQRQADEAKVKQLRAEFDWYRKERRAHEDIWNACFSLYRSQMPDERQSGEWRSKINVPNAWNAVENAVPHLMEGLWGQERPFRLGLAAEDAEIQGHENLLYWEISELMELESEWEEYQRQKAIYGTSAAYVGFRADYEDRQFWQTPRQQGLNGSSQKELVTAKVPSYVGTTFETIDIYNIFPHPRATKKKMKAVFWLRWMTLADVKKFFPEKAHLVGSGMASDQPVLGSYMEEQRGQRTGEANQNPSGGVEQIYPILTKYDDAAKTCQSFTYLGDVLLEDTRYPFFHNRCPLVFDRVTTPPKEFWGVGFIEPILSLAHEHNSIRNQHRDNANLTVNAMFEIRQGAFDDEEDEAIFEPGAFFHTRTGNDIKPIVMPQVSNEAWREEAQVKNDITETTGLAGPLVGQDGMSSASGYQMQQKAQLLRLKRSIRNAALAFKEVISQMLALNVQFLPLDEVFRVLGPMHFKEYTAMDLSDIMARATIIVQPAGIYEDENILRQQTVNLLNILGANPIFAQEVDWQYMLKRTLRVHGEQNPDLALKKPKGIDVMQAMVAFMENEWAVQGRPVPEPGMEDDYAVHLEAHRQQLQAMPDLWQILGPHMVAHDQLEAFKQQQNAMQQMMAMSGQGQPGMPQAGPGARPGINGPGSAPSGARGGVNHNRQPQPTSALSTKRSQARATPKG